ncbi:Retrotransposon-like protein [Artemisia annua]|uniref:Retrotransposon-like protein n=1 Tax=Artemisia annua TaxID=35608 RepID=A0A2U1PL74_ARTAN|nr:Retrotransposon-like protein [Artemisia annua]
MSHSGSSSNHDLEGPSNELPTLPVTPVIHAADFMLETFRGAPHQPAQLTVSNSLPTDSVRLVSVAPVSGSGATSVPIQIMTVDGLVSIFVVANGVPTISDTTQCPPTSEGTSTNMTYFRIGEGSSGSRRVPIRWQRARTGNQHRVDSNESPTQGPIAPPQREGVPMDYKYFGRCDQVCDHCHAVSWLEEKRTGLPVSAAPQTARDKLLEADIPNFQIRLFGVAGSNQYELPTADTIGAIVYEGGPESVTDYDVVIERHSREPESVNKLHPTYMALQFPLLFVFGEEGYHLNLTLRNTEFPDLQQQKKMTIKQYYAY